MKRLLLLFALNCYALTLPSMNNPAVWGGGNYIGLPPQREFTFRYSEPFENFHNGKVDVVWSSERFLVAAGFGNAVLDSIYNELEFSGSLGYKPFDFLFLKIGETANISWVPGDGSWQNHSVLAGADFYYEEWLSVSVSQINLSWALYVETNFNSLYSFGVELPVNKSVTKFRMNQQIALGYFGVYNSFAYPGPVLGFGFALSTGNILAGIGHLRGSYPSGHTGYLVKISKAAMKVNNSQR